jgi:hypothetical protein
VIGFWIFKEGERIYLEASNQTPPGEAPVLAETARSEAGTDERWVTLFEAASPANLLLPEGAAAEVATREGTPFIVLGSAGEVEIALDPARMTNFAGKRILISFSARSGSPNDVQMGVRCQFGASASCDRKRFRVTNGEGEYMFAIPFSSSPGAGAALFITPDLTGGGGIVEINSIRATEITPDQG